MIAVFLILATTTFCGKSAIANQSWFNLGLEQLQKQNYDTAIEYLTKAVEIMPYDFEAFNNRGVAWFGKGDYRRAIEDFTKAVQINPKFEEGFCNRAIAHFHVRLWEATIADAGRALAINPTFFEALNARAAAWTKLRQYGKAIADYRLAFGKEADAPVKNPSAANSNPGGKTGIQGHRTPSRGSGRAAVLQLINKEIQTHGVAYHIQHLNEFAAMARAEALPKTVAPNAKTAAKDVTRTVSPPPIKRTKKVVAPVSAPKRLPKPIPVAGKRVFRPFTIHTSSFKAAATSRRVALGLISKGDPAVTVPVLIPQRGVWYRVLIGFYETRQKAEETANLLKKRKFHYARVITCPYAIFIKRPDSTEAGLRLRRVLGQLGFYGYGTQPSPNGNPTQVVVGAYKTESEAGPYAHQLREAGFTARVSKR